MCTVIIMIDFSQVLKCFNKNFVNHFKIFWRISHIIHKDDSVLNKTRTMLLRALIFPFIPPWTKSKIPVDFVAQCVCRVVTLAQNFSYAVWPYGLFRVVIHRAASWSGKVSIYSAQYKMLCCSLPTTLRTNRDRIGKSVSPTSPLLYPFFFL